MFLVGMIALSFDNIHAELGTCFLPSPALFVGFVHDFAGLNAEVFRLGTEPAGDFLEESVAGFDRGVQGRRRGPGTGGAAARTGRAAEIALADARGDIFRLQAEDLRRHDREYGSFPGAEVLRRTLRQHRAVAANRDKDVVVVRIALAAPGVNSHAQAVFNGTL